MWLNGDPCQNSWENVVCFFDPISNTSYCCSIVCFFLLYFIFFFLLSLFSFSNFKHFYLFIEFFKGFLRITI